MIPRWFLNANFNNTLLLEYTTTIHYYNRILYYNNTPSSVIAYPMKILLTTIQSNSRHSTPKLGTTRWERLLWLFSLLIDFFWCFAGRIWLVARFCFVFCCFFFLVGERSITSICSGNAEGHGMGSCDRSIFFCRRRRRRRRRRWRGHAPSSSRPLSSWSTPHRCENERENTSERERERERERKRLGYGPSPVCNLLVRDDKKKKKELVNRRDPLTKYLIGCWQPTSTDTALHQHVRFASLFLFRKRIFSASKSRVQPNSVVKGR